MVNQKGADGMTLFLLQSTHTVIAADKICCAASLYCKIIPVPRSISSQCGLGIEASEADVPLIADLLRNNGIVFAIHHDYVK